MLRGRAEDWRSFWTWNCKIGCFVAGKMQFYPSIIMNPIKLIFLGSCLRIARRCADRGHDGRACGGCNASTCPEDAMVGIWKAKVVQSACNVWNGSIVSEGSRELESTNFRCTRSQVMMRFLIWIAQWTSVIVDLLRILLIRLSRWIFCYQFCKAFIKSDR